MITSMQFTTNLDAIITDIADHEIRIAALEAVGVGDQGPKGEKGEKG